MWVSLGLPVVFVTVPFRVRFSMGAGNCLRLHVAIGQAHSGLHHRHLRFGIDAFGRAIHE